MNVRQNRDTLKKTVGLALALTLAFAALKGDTGAPVSGSGSTPQAWEGGYHNAPICTHGRAALNAMGYEVYMTTCIRGA